MADLVRAIPLPLTMDFIAISSYGNAFKSSGEVELLKDLRLPIHGRDVIVVEDIVDTGLTLSYLLDYAGPEARLRPRGRPPLQAQPPPGGGAHPLPGL